MIGTVSSGRGGWDGVPDPPAVHVRRPVPGTRVPWRDGCIGNLDIYLYQGHHFVY